MQKICSKCGKKFEYPNNDNYWNNNIHLAPDTLQKLKSIINNICFCTDCINKISKNNL